MMRFRSTNMVDLFNSVTSYMFFDWKHYGQSPNGYGLLTPLEFVDNPIDIGRISTTYDEKVGPSRGCNNCHHVKFHSDTSYGIEEGNPFPNGSSYSSTKIVSRAYYYTRTCQISSDSFMLKDESFYNMDDPNRKPPWVKGMLSGYAIANGTLYDGNRWFVNYDFYDINGKHLHTAGYATLSKSIDYTVYFIPSTYGELFTPEVGKWVSQCNRESSFKSFSENAEADLVQKALDNGREMMNNYENVNDLIGILSTLGSGVTVQSDYLKAIRALAKQKGTLGKLLSKASCPTWVYVAIKAFTNLWMSYRYVYKTTELDAMSALDTANQMLKTSLLDIPFHTYRSGGAYLNGKWAFSFRLRPRNYHSFYKSANDLGVFLDKFYLALGTLGLDPSMANFWDMVPLSFVVDWFLPLGNYLKCLANCKVFDHATITDCQYSYKSYFTLKYKSTDIQVSYYRRKYIILNPGMYYSDSTTSKQTAIKRFIDGICIILN